MIITQPKHRLTQHKRFVSNGTHPDPLPSREREIDSPSPGGRELEGGGNSPSPYSSPVKGEETFLGIATLCSQ